MKKGHLSMPLLFVVSGRWKNLYGLVKKTLRHSCRSKRCCKGECVARQWWLSTYRRAGFYNSLR